MVQLGELVPSQLWRVATPISLIKWQKKGILCQAQGLQGLGWISSLIQGVSEAYQPVIQPEHRLPLPLRSRCSGSLAQLFSGEWQDHFSEAKTDLSIVNVIIYADRDGACVSIARLCCCTNDTGLKHARVFKRGCVGALFAVMSRGLSTD